MKNYRQCCINSKGTNLKWIEKEVKARTANRQGFVASVRRTMKPLLHGTGARRSEKFWTMGIEYLSYSLTASILIK